MNDRDPQPTRRTFLKTAGAAALGAALGGAACRQTSPRPSRAADPARDGGAEAAPAPETSPPPADAAAPAPAEATRDGSDGPSGSRAEVVLVRDRDAVDDEGRVDAAVVARMLDDAVRALTGEAEPRAAWGRLVAPGDLVGIKSNEWEELPTPPEVEAAIVEALVGAGAVREAVRIDDRGARETLADRTALFNVRPLRTHHWAGIGGCIKNYIIFVERPDAYHPDSCADLGSIWKLPIVEGKTRLNVLLALTPLFWGRGPHHFDARYVWPYGGLFASFDPVAVDALGARLLLAKRIQTFGEERTVVPTHHIDYAETRHGIGVADLSRIDLRRIGWEENALI